MVKGNPAIKKSLNLYWPGPKTMRLVWYPMGVIKLAEAPKHIDIRKALVGSRAISGLVIWKWFDSNIARGDRIIATAAFDMNADVIKVIKYKIEIT